MRKLENITSLIKDWKQSFFLTQSTDSLSNFQMESDKKK